MSAAAQERRDRGFVRRRIGRQSQLHKRCAGTISIRTPRAASSFEATCGSPQIEPIGIVDWQVNDYPIGTSPNATTHWLFVPIGIFSYDVLMLIQGQVPS